MASGGTEPAACCCDALASANPPLSAPNRYPDEPLDIAGEIEADAAPWPESMSGELALCTRLPIIDGCMNWGAAADRGCGRKLPCP